MTSTADDGPPTTTEEMLQAIRRDGVEFILAMFVNMDGKPCAKLIPAAAAEGFVRDGAGFAGFAAGGMGQRESDPDLLAMPDPCSYSLVPWQPGVALVQCDPHVDGEPWAFSPRLILKRQLERVAAHGYVLKVGAEAEYMMVRRDSDGTLVVADDLDTSTAPCYDARDLLRMLPHLAEVSRMLNGLGWGNYANDHEDGNGQFEQNFAYADALTTADRMVMFRYMIHSLAEQRGMEATFMPKPFHDRTGNGLHLHLSLWSQAGEELFKDPSDPRGLGTSELGYQFIGGLLDHAQAWVAVTCPTVNSYKRIGVGAPASGATWAPSYVAYGGNNRTHLLRIPEPGRVENRAVDGSANPYLALAVLAAAGLHGIESAADPGEANSANLFEVTPAELRIRGIDALPPTLLHAVDGLRADPVIVDALGCGPPGSYADYFAEVKADEFRTFHAQVTPWEIDRYLTMH